MKFKAHLAWEFGGPMHEIEASSVEQAATTARTLYGSTKDTGHEDWLIVTPFGVRLLVVVGIDASGYLVARHIVAGGA